jgi:hypothetical protein
VGVQEEERLWTELIDRYSGVQANWKADVIGRWAPAWDCLVLLSLPVSAWHGHRTCACMHVCVRGACSPPHRARGEHLTASWVRLRKGHWGTAAMRGRGRASCKQRWTTTRPPSSSAHGRWTLSSTGGRDSHHRELAAAMPLIAGECGHGVFL